MPKIAWASQWSVMSTPCPIQPFSNLDDANATASTNSLLLSRLISQNEIIQLNFVAYGVVGTAIIAFGIIGNILNLLVLAQPSLKGVTYVYLFWLVIADLLALFASLTSMIRLQGVQPRTYGAAVYFAHIEVALVNAFMAASVFIVIALTVDRYFSVCLPTRFREVHNARRAKKNITFSYLFAFALYVPVCFEMIPVAVGTEYIACENEDIVSSAYYKGYLIVKEILVRVGPVVILVVLNITIIFTFRKVVKRRREHLTGPRQFLEARRLYEERRLLILLGSIAVLFVVCMTPAAILTVLYSDDKEYDYSFQLFRAVANCLEISNYSLNFCVYCLCSNEIRRTFIGLLSKCKPKKSCAILNAVVLTTNRSFMITH